jgi:lysophospholipase L1-like esterase
MSQQTTKYLALGDSYTIGESVAENERWPVQLSEALRKKGRNIEGPTIIATTGWRTDNLKNAVNIAQLKEEYGMVSLLIGVNNQYQGKSIEQFRTEFEDLLKTSIKLAGGKKENVFVVSIPDYGFTPYGKPKQEKISKELDEYNNISRTITEQYGVRYFYITDISRNGLKDPSLVATDGLHPSGKMYTQWVDLILKDL